MTIRQAKRLREGDRIRHADGISGRVENVFHSVDLIVIIWDDGVQESLPFDGMESITLERGD